MVISLIFSKLEVPNNNYYIMITESKVTEIFCIADDFCKEFEEEMAKKAKKAIAASPCRPRRRRKRMMSPISYI